MRPQRFDILISLINAVNQTALVLGLAVIVLSFETILWVFEMEVSVVALDGCLRKLIRA